MHKMRENIHSEEEGEEMDIDLYSYLCYDKGY